MRKRKVVESKRRLPRRAKALETVEVIFEATARILQSEGRAGLNTNRIAEKAGVSIGAIYGYFPNKDAILLAMARRELDALRDRVAAALMDTGSEEPDPARRAVRALIKGYAKRLVGQFEFFVVEAFSPARYAARISSFKVLCLLRC